MTTIAHQTKIKLLLTNKPCSLFEGRVASCLCNEINSDFNLKKSNKNYK